MVRQKTALIADGDRAFVSALKKRCESLDVHAVSAFDAMGALFAIRDTMPDVVCLDLKLPDVPGLEVCRMLAFDAGKKRLSLLDKKIEMVLLTADTDLDVVRACTKFGVHYVDKGPDLWARLHPVLCDLLEIEAATGGRAIAVPHQPLWIEETEGDFSRRFEDAEPAAPAETAVAEPGRNPEPAVDLRERDTLLVVEDDPGMVDVVRRFVEGMDCRVIHCEGEDDTLRNAPDAAVVICDIHLTGVRGTFIIRSLREQGYKGPVIVITGDSTSTTVMECARARVDAMLLKPFSKTEFIDQLNSITRPQALGAR